MDWFVRDENYGDVDINDYMFNGLMVLLWRTALSQVNDIWYKSRAKELLQGKQLSVLIITYSSV